MSLFIYFLFIYFLEYKASIHIDNTKGLFLKLIKVPYMQGRIYKILDLFTIIP